VVLDGTGTDEDVSTAWCWHGNGVVLDGVVLVVLVPSTACRARRRDLVLGDEIKAFYRGDDDKQLVRQGQ
jgi:hypothetical protein